MTRPGAAAFARSSQVSVSYGLEGADIIYIAEKHDEAFHHRFQEKIIRSLHRQGKPVTEGMEMIDLTQQAALDDYLDKRISWNEFVRRTAFDLGWGRTSPAYARILSWCRRNEVPVIALNAPQTVTRKLARNEPLTAEEKRLVPTYPEPPGGFKQFQTAMAGHANAGSLGRYYEAQRAWDQTMAGRILAWLPNHSGTLVVLLGRFHADPGPACLGTWRESRTSRRSFFFQHEIRGDRAHSKGWVRVLTAISVTSRKELLPLLLLRIRDEASGSLGQHDK